MKYYALDTEDRLKIYFLIALSTAVLMFLIGQLGDLNNYVNIIAPSGLMIYAGLIAVFDKYIWDLPYINSFTGVPVLSGNWEGTLIRENATGDKVERKVTLLITQNWRKMSLVFSGEKSVSEAQIISMFSENKHYIKIKWVYISSDTSGIEHQNLYGEGTTDLALKIIDGKKSLTGTYYSSKLKKGRITLEYKGAHK